MFLGCHSANNSILPSLYCSFFKKFGEHWDFFHIPSEEYPTEEEIAKVDAIVIPGSSSSAYKEHKWRGKICQIIQDIRFRYPNKKLLGICFGAQITCEALGGKVEKMESTNYIEGSEILEIE